MVHCEVGDIWRLAVVAAQDLAVLVEGGRPEEPVTCGDDHVVEIFVRAEGTSLGKVTRNCSLCRASVSTFHLLRRRYLLGTSPEISNVRISCIT